MVMSGDLMSQMLNKMYIIIHSRDDLQYLLSVIYIMMCTGFVSAWRLSTEHVVVQPLHLYPVSYTHLTLPTNREV